MIRRLLIIILAVVLAATLKASASEQAKVSFRVIDEIGAAVDQAQIKICFFGGCLTKEAIVGSTDSEGKYSVSADSKDGQIGGVVRKDGFYPSVFGTQFIQTKLGKWLPWDKEIIVKLRPKVNPVPMYVRNRYFEIPAQGKEIGFDLMKADWVIPYGQGVQSDFIMRVDREYKNTANFEATLTLTFSNKYDGIQIIKDDRGGVFSQGSRYNLPRQAPENGYQAKLVKRISRGIYGWHDDKAADNNYIFRVRSEVDEEGKLKRAMYGKIRGEIKFAALSKNGEIGMHYYLNPDFTRNLEFDPEKNLFKLLPSGEGIAWP